MRRKQELEEHVIQKFSYRCPYCDRPVAYDDLHLKPGENEVKCPSCKKKYIKVALDNSPPSSPSPIKGEGKKGLVKGEGNRGSVKGKN